MKRFTFCAIIFFALSCNSEGKKDIGSILPDLTYYAVTQDGIQTMSINNDSLIFFRTVGTRNDFFSFDSLAYRIDVEKNKIANLTIIDSSRLDVYVSMKDKFKKYFILQNSIKDRIFVLSEDTLFSSLETAKEYNPDLNKKFSFAYYTKKFLEPYKAKDLVFHMDSIHVNRFIKSLKQLAADNELKIKNTNTIRVAFGGGREMLTQTLISMNLNPFVHSDSLKTVLKTITTEN